MAAFNEYFQHDCLISYDIVGSRHITDAVFTLPNRNIYCARATVIIIYFYTRLVERPDSFFCDRPPELKVLRAHLFSFTNSWLSWGGDRVGPENVSA